MTDESSAAVKDSTPPVLRVLLVWLAITICVTAILWFFRGTLDKAHMALGFLLLVLGGSTRGGRVVGVVLSVVGFLTFNFFLLPPLYTLGIHDPLDWWVLIAFLTTGLVASQMFYRGQRAAALAERVEALREADQLKDALLASVSHDLRTPLTSIRATAAELRETGDDRAAIIEEEADRLNRMVTDLLDLSRIRAGVVAIEMEINAAEDLVGTALAQLRGMGAEQRIQVRLPPDGTLLVGRFDFVQALRSLVNLLENALRHSPEGDPIELEVSRSESDLVFRVKDRGEGIREADRQRIFEPFFRPDDRSGNVPGGVGLGLAITKRLIELQGGRVRYRPRPGGGSVFEFTLPASDLTDLTA